MIRNLMLRLTLVPLLVLAPTLVHAQTSGGMRLLALFGAAPHHADQQAHFELGITSPSGQQYKTTLFDGLDGVSGPVELPGWGVRPLLLMRGQWVGLHGTVQFDFGASREAAPEVTADRTFSVTTRYHSGLNLAGVLGPDAPVMLTVGPMLEAGIGPRLRVQHTDGSHAQWGRIGEVRFAPATAFAVMGGPVVVHSIAAWYPPGAPWEFVGASGGEASGRWDAADPTDPDQPAEAEEYLQRVRGDGGYLVSGGASLALGGGGEEPGLALGVTFSLVERRYSVAEGGFGVQDGFSERDARLLFTIGITIPSLD
jgi:hypothetical protein